MAKSVWSGVLPGLVMVGGSLQADDAVKLGRFQADPQGFGAMVRSAQVAEGPETPGADDTENAHWGRRRFWGGFSAGYAAGSWGRGWGGGWGGYAYGGGWHRPYYSSFYYSPSVYYYPRVVSYSSFGYGYTGGWGNGWCGISGTSAPIQTLNIPATTVATPGQTVPDAVPSVKPIPPATDDGTTIPVKLPASSDSKPSYKFPAYGDKK